MGRELLAVVWFLFVAVVFFGTYVGLALPVAALQAAYAVFLLAVVVGVFLQRGRRPEQQTTEEGMEKRVD